MDHKKVGKLWDENADNWIAAAKNGYDVWRDHLNTPAFLNMLPNISDKCGLEIGFGDGYNSALIAARCKYLTCIDLSEKFHSHNLENNKLSNAEFHIMDASATSFKNESFDFVVAVMSLMDVPDLDKTLKEIYRILAPRGFLQFSIVHPCFNEHKGFWKTDSDGNIIGFLMEDYFEESDGEIHKWQHKASPTEMQNFCIPRFSKPLHKWLNCLIKAGFTIEDICEPAPSKESIQTFPALSSTWVVAHSIILRVRKINYEH